MPGKKDRYDKTSAKRATEHLKRLAESEGKRLPVDLTGKHVKQLDELIAAGDYGKSAAAVIRKAIEKLHDGLQKGAGN